MIHDYSTGSKPGAGEKTWTTAELTAEFDVLGFSAPFVSVRRKSDGQTGMMEFTHQPRVYWDFVPVN